MVDYNEAIKNLQTIQGMPLTIRMAIEALEKQMPKKPVRGKYFRPYCPNCGEKIKTQEILLDTWGGVCPKITEPNCCNGCGQAIDWGDE